MPYLSNKEREENEKTLEIPEGLCDPGLNAARIILSFLERRRLTYTGGCTLFYSPAQWRRRKEEFGGNALLIVVHDGGGQSEVFGRGNWQTFRTLQDELKKIGLYCEPCTCWYSAIWPISRKEPAWNPGSANADVENTST